MPAIFWDAGKEERQGPDPQGVTILWSWLTSANSYTFLLLFSQIPPSSGTQDTKHFYSLILSITWSKPETDGGNLCSFQCPSVIQPWCVLCWHSVFTSVRASYLQGFCLLICHSFTLSSDLLEDKVSMFLGFAQFLNRFKTPWNNFWTNLKFSAVNKVWLGSFTLHSEWV